MKRLLVLFAVLVAFAQPVYAGSWLLGQDGIGSGDQTLNGDLTVTGSGQISMSQASVSANSGTIKAMPDDILENGTAIGCTGGGCANGRTFFTLGQPYRLKNSNPIKQIKFYREGTIEAACSWISFEVVRGNGDSAGTDFSGFDANWQDYVPDKDQTYNIVESTGNIITEMQSQCSSGGSCTFTLPTELTLAQRGDYLAGTVVASSTCQIWGWSNSGANSYIFWSGATATGSTFDVHGGSKAADEQIIFEAYTDPATLVVTGDSLAEGATGNRDFMQSQQTTTDLTGNIAYHLGQLSGWSYESLGKSGITMANTDSYFDTTALGCTAGHCVLDLLPEIAYIVAGHNDVATGVPQATTIAELTSILDKCEVARAAGNLTRCMVLGVPPWTAGTDTQSRLIDDLNIAMAETTAGYNNAIFIDSADYIGKARATGPSGNLWDISTSPDYNDDNTHLNSAGYAQVAQASWDIYNSTNWLTATNNTPVLIVSKDSQQVGVGGYPANGNSLTVSGNASVSGNLHVGDSVRFGTSEFKTATVEVSSAEILALNGSPKTLIASQGSDTIIDVESVIIILDAGTPYNGIGATEDLIIEYAGGNDITNSIETTGFLDSATDIVKRYDSVGDDDLTSSVGELVKLRITSGNVATGTGTLTIKITYRVHSLGL